MTIGVEVKGLKLNYGSFTALNDVTFSLEGGKIYGLLGRNGSGKTSLLSLLASFRMQTDGDLLIDGEAPFENERITRQVCFIQESITVMEGIKVKQVIDLARDCWPNWDDAYAERLIKHFGFPLNKDTTKLSRGMKSALGITIGMASRAELTIFDEAYLGLDAPSRYFFYDELLKDYMENPRTFILSTHLIEEVGSLFEEVLILDRGKLMLHEDCETLRFRGASITGPAGKVDDFAIGLQVLGSQQLGGTKSVTVYGELSEERRKRAASEGLELGPVSLQDMFVHLTNRKEGVQ